MARTSFDVRDRLQRMKRIVVGAFTQNFFFGFVRGYRIFMRMRKRSSCDSGSGYVRYADGILRKRANDDLFIR